jgi:hypothetical protein
MVAVMLESSFHHWTLESRAEGCMADFVFVVLTVAFFAISIAYVRFCDWVK